jgi:hypothetical protein
MSLALNTRGGAMACSVADLSDVDESPDYSFLEEALSSEYGEGDNVETSGSDEAYQPNPKKRQRLAGDKAARKIAWGRGLMAKESKKTGKGRSRKERFRYDYEQKAKVVAGRENRGGACENRGEA